MTDLPMDALLVDTITHLTRRMRTVFDARVKEEGTTLARARILRQLKRGGEVMTQRALAAALEIEGPTLVRLLEALETGGLIERRAVEGDRRAKHIFLTAEGRLQADHVERIATAFRSRLVDGVKLDDMTAALDVLTRLARNLEDMA